MKTIRSQLNALLLCALLAFVAGAKAADPKPATAKPTPTPAKATPGQPAAAKAAPSKPGDPKPAVARAASAKTYQVTGPVLELTETLIVVQKGDDKWQIARSKNTHVPADLKVGDKVTIHYQMMATDVEAKN